MTVIKQRAVNPEQKRQRVEQILDAAELRFTQAPFAQIRLVDIAADVGITKAAFYRYFRKKELVFLALYLRHLNRVTQHMELHIESGGLIKTIVNSCAIHETFCKLNGILHTVLEHNISLAEAVAFKREVASLMSISIEAFLPYLTVSKNEAIDLFLMMHQIIIGAWVTCNPTPVIRQAIDANPELILFNLSFTELLEKHLQLLFRPYLR